MRRPLTKELLILCVCALPVLVQYAIMESEDENLEQFLMEVAGIYAATMLVRGVRKWARLVPKGRAADPRIRRHLRVEIEIREQEESVETADH